MLRAQHILKTNSHLSLVCVGGDRVTCKRSGKEADAVSTGVASSLVAPQARAEAAAEAPREAGAVRVVHQEGRLREVVPSVIPQPACSNSGTGLQQQIDFYLVDLSKDLVTVSQAC